VTVKLELADILKKVTYVCSVADSNDWILLLKQQRRVNLILA
jgi:hypothetical protein